MSRRLSWVWACVAGLACGQVAGEDAADAVIQAEQARIAAIGKATKTAVAVFGPGNSQGGGSGVVITPDGFALTNYHVSKPCGDWMKCGMADGKMYDAVIVGIDPTGDVALIKLLGRTDFPSAELADSDAVRVGDWCFAVGNPFLLATNLEPTVSYGIVSGVHRYQPPAGTLLEYADCLQTDAAINPGNSGGPLFDAQGRVIGINGRGSFEKRGRVNVGVGYAISINQIKKFLGHLHSGRIVDHATLGATVTSDVDGRVVVTNILESSDAYRRGLRFDDEIVAFGGRPITTVNGFKNVLGIFPKGWRAPISWRREGQRYDALVRLTGVHRQEELVQLVDGAPKKPVDPKRGRDKPDGDKPDEKKPEEKKPDEKKPEDKPEQKLMPLPQKPKVPAEIAKLIEKRTGYANYYFNRLNRDRVWKAFSAHGNFADTKDWTLDGQFVGGGAVKITLGETKADGKFPTGDATLDTAKDLDEQLGPKGSGGLLLALHLWRRFARLGPSQFGDVTYFGTGPWPGREAWCDILVATHDVVETRLYFDPSSGYLVGLEMYPDSGVDPCEVWFDDYRAVGGRDFPHRMSTQFGNGVRAEIEWKSIGG